MSVKCPVTNKECPYLKKLDSDICPREHECDVVKESYSKMIQKPPSPRKFLIILFSVLLVSLISVCVVYFFILDKDLSLLGLGNKMSEATPTPVSTAAADPTPENTPGPTSAHNPTETTTAAPTPVSTPAPTALPPVPLTSNSATKPVRIELDDLIAEVQNVPLDENQKIAVLPTARIISWYEGSYLPGNEGNCILFGYKHYGGIAGIFYNLEKLQPGDKITFTLDNGTKITQTVIDSIIYRGGILPNDTFIIESENPRTVIISETGSIDSETGGYIDLIVVYTQ